MVDGSVHMLLCIDYKYSERDKMKPKVVLTQWVHPDVIRLLEHECEVVPNEPGETFRGMMP